MAKNNIESIGLKQHLDSSRYNHYDNGYDDLVSMLERKLTKVNIARMFGVNRATVEKWLEVYQKELQK